MTNYLDPRTLEEAMREIRHSRKVISELRAELDRLKQQEPIAYLAYRGDQPSWDEDCVCEDAVSPVDEDDDRTSMPVYLAAGAQP